MKKGYKTYICIGGETYSRRDGQKHYIPAIALTGLYKVKRSDCILVTKGREEIDLAGLNMDNYIILRPDPAGEYKIPAFKGDLKYATRSAGDARKESGTNGEDQDRPAS